MIGAKSDLGPRGYKKFKLKMLTNKTLGEGKEGDSKKCPLFISVGIHFPQLWKKYNKYKKYAKYHTNRRGKGEGEKKLKNTSIFKQNISFVVHISCDPFSGRRKKCRIVIDSLWRSHVVVLLNHKRNKKKDNNNKIQRKKKTKTKTQTKKQKQKQKHKQKNKNKNKKKKKKTKKKTKKKKKTKNKTKKKGKGKN
jgi:hypothetical protein